jgi:hypothetical protein
MIVRGIGVGSLPLMKIIGGGSSIERIYMRDSSRSLKIMERSSSSTPASVKSTIVAVDL